jgi:hypothetical protein
MGRRIHIIQIWIYLVWHRHARSPGWPASKALIGGIGLNTSRRSWPAEVKAHRVCVCPGGKP